MKLLLAFLFFAEGFAFMALSSSLPPAPTGYLRPPAPAPIAQRTLTWSAPDYPVDRYEIWQRPRLESGSWQFLATTRSNAFTVGIYLDSRFFTVLAVTPGNLYSPINPQPN